MEEQTKRPIWEICQVVDGLSGRGDIAALQLAHVLGEGWEPFAVAKGFIWLKRQEIP